MYYNRHRAMRIPACDAARRHATANRVQRSYRRRLAASRVVALSGSPGRVWTAGVLTSVSPFPSTSTFWYEKPDYCASALIRVPGGHVYRGWTAYAASVIIARSGRRLISPAEIDAACISTLPTLSKPLQSRQRLFDDLINTHRKGTEK
ncbi:MAG: hypothetical protein OXI12_13980 [Gammaproteobacteria bacterium]|nr:hypothetical protein [Gammaproteobacteria bacterium]